MNRECATCGHDLGAHEMDDGLTGEDGPCWENIGTDKPDCPCERFKAQS